MDSSLKAFNLILESFSQVSHHFYLSSKALSFVCNFCLNFVVAFFSKLDIFYLSLKSLNLKFLCFNLLLIRFKFAGIFTHLIFYMVKLLHVLIDLCREIFDIFTCLNVFSLLSLSLFIFLSHCTFYCSLQFLFYF